MVQWAVAAATDGQSDGQLRSRLRNRFGASATFLQSGEISRVSSRVFPTYGWNGAPCLSRSAGIKYSSRRRGEDVNGWGEWKWARRS